MTDKLTPRHKAFLAAYRASGYENASKAYASVYTTCRTPDQAAANCLRLPQVRAELDRVQAEDAEASKLGLQRIVQEWEALLIDAKQGNDPVTRARALENMGKIAGVYIEKTEDVTKSSPVDPAGLTKLIEAIVPVIANALQASSNPTAAVMAALGITNIDTAKPTAH